MERDVILVGGSFLVALGVSFAASYYHKKQLFAAKNKVRKESEIKIDNIRVRLFLFLKENFNNNSTSYIDTKVKALTN